MRRVINMKKIIKVCKICLVLLSLLSLLGACILSNTSNKRSKQTINSDMDIVYAYCKKEGCTLDMYYGETEDGRIRFDTIDKNGNVRNVDICKKYYIYLFNK